MNSYQLNYRILTENPSEPIREVDVQASHEQIRFLEEEGYLIRPRLVEGALLERLRAAADELEAIERPKVKSVEGKNFGGLYIRNLLDRHPAFLELLKFQPTLSVARAVLGPQVQIHGSVLRFSYPDQKHQAVEWHFHQRVIPEPRPHFFYRPCVIDNLIYLDDITEESGPLVVMPRTHLSDQALLSGDLADKPGQVVVTCPAGTCVTAHASLWHRALAPKPSAKIRRLLILGYSPTWMKQVDRPGWGLTKTLTLEGDLETRELLGYAGYL